MRKWVLRSTTRSSLVPGSFGVPLGELAFTPDRGDARRLEVIVTPLLSADNVAIAVSVTFADVTRYAALQSELEGNRRDLELAYEELQSTIDDDVILSWIGTEPDYLLHQHVISVQLFKVAIFLGSFSGLYFTVYAITDATYRQQFFTEILRELERAVGVRAVYRDLQDHHREEDVRDGGKPAPPAPAG